MQICPAPGHARWTIPGRSGAYNRFLVPVEKWSDGSSSTIRTDVPLIEVEFLVIRKVKLEPLELLL